MVPPLTGTVHRRLPARAAAKSVLLAYARPLGDASVSLQVTTGFVKLGLLHGPSQAGQP